MGLGFRSLRSLAFMSALGFQSSAVTVAAGSAQGRVQDVSVVGLRLQDLDWISRLYSELAMIGWQVLLIISIVLTSIGRS